METQFKLAAEEDIPLVLDMMKDFNEIYNYPFDAELGSINLNKLINNKELGRFWIIYQGGLIAGYVALTFGFSFEYKGRDAFIDELFLKESFRNKGIGKQTMEFLEKQAIDLDLGAIHMEVERENDKAMRLYSKQGYGDFDRNMLTKKFK
ncbi:GNAT family N-acetyltransferase [Chondrinema litorale]|uniref:GNAT family N-acetyltransferase n=1 Tax=Chondrinema litorale TaxID=2994555 RepID=UPI00254388DF|nr:GNAT family N-acetyltransferase [Chondrinema litorale]UZR99224.1 GNAT family N-acetyltransferase [Chondrinema litorale]